MSEAVYDTLGFLFGAIKKHRKETGADIYHNSDPKRLLIGWQCGDNCYYIKLSTLRKRTAIIGFDEETYNLLCRLLMGESGRKQIADILNFSSDSYQECFDRFLKLKAFW